MLACTRTSIGIKILIKDFISYLTIDNFSVVYNAILNSVIDKIDNDYANNAKRKEIHRNILDNLTDFKKLFDMFEYVKLKLSDEIFNNVYILLSIKDLLKCSIVSNDCYNYDYLEFQNIDFDIDTKLKTLGFSNYSVIFLSIINNR